jgi:hypothetical protein
MAVIELHIPLEIPSQNATGRGANWRIRASGVKRLRNLWQSHAMIEMRAKGLVHATGPRSLHVVAYRRQRCTDIANLIGGAKACIDGLTRAGVLLDDRDSMARITYEQQTAGKSPTKQPHTILRVDDIPGNEAI